jgi:hypothetical protein
LSGCAQKLTPQQEYAYNAVDTCAKEHGNVGWTYWVTPEGGIRFEGRPTASGPLSSASPRNLGTAFDEPRVAGRRDGLAGAPLVDVVDGGLGSADEVEKPNAVGKT